MIAANLGFTNPMHDVVKRFLPVKQDGCSTAHDDSQRGVIERDGNTGQIHHQCRGLGGEPRFQVQLPRTS